MNFLRNYSRHENLVQLVESFLSEDQTHFHMVMEYMEMNLYQVIVHRNNRPFSDATIQSILFQLMDGINFIHQCGFFHRDIKPENILVTVTTTPSTIRARVASATGVLTPLAAQARHKYIIKIADFGLVRAERDTRPLTGYVSTRWYRAPELLLRKPNYGQPIDIFAWGCVAYELAHLKPLFPAGSEWEMFYMMLKFLGTPLRSDNCPPVFSKQVEIWDEGHKLAERMKYKVISCERSIERKISSKYFGTDFIDLLNSSLKWNPKQRINSAAALRHPYFGKLRRTAAEKREFALPLPQQQQELADIHRLTKRLQEPPHALDPSKLQISPSKNNGFRLFEPDPKLLSEFRMSKRSGTLLCPTDGSSSSTGASDRLQGHRASDAHLVKSPLKQSLPSLNDEEKSRRARCNAALNEFKWVNYSAVNFSPQVGLKRQSVRQPARMNAAKREAISGIIAEAKPFEISIDEKGPQESDAPIEPFSQKIALERYPRFDSSMLKFSTIEKQLPTARCRKQDRLAKSLGQSLMVPRANDPARMPYADQQRPTSKRGHRESRQNHNSTISDVFIDFSRHLTRMRANRRRAAIEEDSNEMSVDQKLESDQCENMMIQRCRDAKFWRDESIEDVSMSSIDMK